MLAAIVLERGPGQPMTRWDALAVLGALAWPIGLLGFGGFGEGAGPEIVAAGSVLVVVSQAAGFWGRAGGVRRRLRGRA
ncbi:MAG: hypothetical protein QOG15_642 [Solirubrobacteraceae bacterium]|jgi:hypothetical protein|nr:hypothetical protein [Solirubrobacteraceae bacterium]